MLYSEFVENTGCMANEFNHRLFLRLELIYMNDDTITKEEIYDMGRKLMNNEKPQYILELENDLKEELEERKERIQNMRTEIKSWQSMIKQEQENPLWESKQLIHSWRGNIKWLREQIKIQKRKIEGIKWILERGDKE